MGFESVFNFVDERDMRAARVVLKGRNNQARRARTQRPQGQIAIMQRDAARRDRRAMNVQLRGKGLPYLHGKMLAQFLGSRGSDGENILVGFAKGVARGTAGGRQLLGHLAAFTDAVKIDCRPQPRWRSA